MAGFLVRLKQRKLVQWALAYIAAAFALIQVIDVVASRFDWPAPLERSIILALAVGFVVALVIAWYHGEKGRQRVSGPELLLIALVLAIGGGAVWYFGRPASSPVAVARMARSNNAAVCGSAPCARSAPVCRSAPCARVVAETQDRSPAAPAPTQAGSAQSIPVKSVAVLPLVNESGDKDQQYFSDGLSEDLITALSQFAGLKVINRDSSFQFRDSKDSVQVIGEQLGVAHLLEGSVQRLGGEVRISAELVNVSDGSTLWSQHYDRPYKDLFALQDDITKAVADALKARLLDTGNGAVVQSDRPPSGNLAAYSALLRGNAYADLGTAAGMRLAIAQYAGAAKLDPRYAAAYAGESQAWSLLGGSFAGGADEQRDYAQAKAAADMALQIDPDLAAAHAARAEILVDNFDWTGALAEQKRAVALAPGNPLAKFNLASIQSRLGHPDSAVELMRQVLPSLPLSPEGYFGLARALNGLGRLDEAQAALQKVIELAPGFSRAYAYLTIVAVQRGDAAAALDAARREPRGKWRDFAMTLALQVGTNGTAADAALESFIHNDADADAYQVAEIYAVRKDPDNMFKWLDQARANDDAGIQLLLFDPLILRYQHDPRFAAFCRKVGLPTTTDAKAMP